MISDVLYEAANDIRSYLREIPQAYGDAAFQLKINALLAQTDSLRRELDTPPGLEVVEQLKPARRSLNNLFQ